MKELENFTVEILEEWINAPENITTGTRHKLIATKYEPNPKYPRSRRK